MYCKLNLKPLFIISPDVLSHLRKRYLNSELAVCPPLTMHWSYHAVLNSQHLNKILLPSSTPIILFMP